MPGPKHADAIVEFRDCYVRDVLVDPEYKDIKIKIFRVQERDGRMHVWMTVAGQKNDLKRLQRRLSKAKGVSHVVMSGSQFSRLVYMTFSAERCDRRGVCPLASPNSRFFARFAVIKEGRMFAYVSVATRKGLEELERNGFRVASTVDNGANTYLTRSQEKLLLFAYELGYYSYPREVGLKDLAKALNVSVSALAEKLRNAEAKIVGRIVREELEITRHLDNSE